MYPALLSEDLALVQVLGPVDLGAESSSSSSAESSSSSSSSGAGTPPTPTGATEWFDAGRFNRILGVLFVGETGDTVDFSLQQATNSAGGGAKSITSKSITQLAATDDNKQAMINLRTAELDVSNGFNYVRALVDTNDSTVCVAVFASDARHGPASNHNVSTVAEVVS